MGNSQRKKKKENLTVTVSFKNNINDKLIYEWLEMKSETIGKSSYIKELIKLDMESSNHSN
ncbi:MAG: hypothetical protein J6D47_11910 [Peptostreptococcaceae bacterium]|nr:hypothetical protein [Peptostreptococcaceae bacterium]